MQPWRASDEHLARDLMDLALASSILSLWRRTFKSYVWESYVAEGPGDSPSTGLTLNKLCNAVVLHLQIQVLLSSYRLDRK